MCHLRSLLIIGEKPRGTTMADDDIENLKKARSALVEARRSAARTLANPNSKSGSDARNFTEIQEGIEAIDRAIEELQDEEDEDEDE
jgi:hypothetical protein